MTDRTRAWGDERPGGVLGAWPRALRLGLTALALAGGSACGGLSHIAHDPASMPRIFSTTATLRGEPFELHLAVPSHPRSPDVLVLYASGDGGWFGSAVDMFRALGTDGFYAVGLSTRTLLHAKSSSGQAPTVGDLAEDYRAILDRATDVLHMPGDSRVVLTGWSRGASLAVLVGGTRHAPDHLAGVIAIGLAAEENLAAASDSDDDPDVAAGKPPARDGTAMAMYALIDEVAPRRCAVIQATGDRYLASGRARQLFGPDTDTRRFFEVPAKNHRFGGGADAFAASLLSSLEWVVSGPRDLPVP